ncbi:hypothetical protein L218DRAFT_119630 [Marasmius fiardii PR-910]|nr:hypothetical protein L218DRAFT_119630 [Marasmius fiardii PR-910]
MMSTEWRRGTFSSTSELPKSRWCQTPSLSGLYLPHGLLLMRLTRFDLVHILLSLAFNFNFSKPQTPSLFVIRE